MSAKALISVPESPEEAIESDSSDQWQTAIREELTALAKCCTCEVVQKHLNLGEISAKWVFALKDMGNDNVGSKARQIEGVDSEEIFATVVKIDSIRLLFSSTCSIYNSM